MKIEMFNRSFDANFGEFPSTWFSIRKSDQIDDNDVVVEIIVCNELSNMNVSLPLMSAADFRKIADAIDELNKND